MTETAKRLYGAPVSAQGSEEVLGYISDFVFDAETNAVLALVITTNSIIPLTRMILAEDVVNIDSFRAVVVSADKICGFDKNELSARATAYFEDFHGRRTNGGKTDKAKIRNAVFDIEAGELTDFIVSDGRIKSMLRRGKRIAARSVRKKDGSIIIDISKKQEEE